MNVKKGYKQLVAEAEKQIQAIDSSELKARLENLDESLVIIDLRDVREVKREGKIAGSLHIPRGMLEFWICPDSPYHKPVFAEDKEFVFFCAGAMRSALAAKVAQDMGLKPVAHMLGGFGAWKKAGAAIELDEEK